MEMTIRIDDENIRKILHECNLNDEGGYNAAFIDGYKHLARQLDIVRYADTERTYIANPSLITKDDMVGEIAVLDREFYDFNKMLKMDRSPYLDLGYKAGDEVREWHYRWNDGHKMSCSILQNHDRRLVVIYTLTFDGELVNSCTDQHDIGFCQLMSGKTDRMYAIKVIPSKG